MKKFQFSLQSVLTYKQQILDTLVGEHGAILAALNAQEEKVRLAYQRYDEYNTEYRAAKAEGMTAAEALGFQNGLEALDRAIKMEEEKLAAVRKREEEKRAEVVEAKKDTSSLEKLRESKLESYRQLEQKNEEAFIDELVSTERTIEALEAQQMEARLRTNP